MKRTISLLLSLIVLFSCSSVAFAVEADDIVKDEVEYAQGQDIILRNVEVLENGFIVITEEISEEVNEINTIDGVSEKEKTKVFSHRILDRNGVEMAVLYSTVTGVYSEADNEAYLTSITGVFTGSFASRFSYSSSVSGDTGSIAIFFYGAYAASFSYKIYSNGTIQQI